MTPRIQRILKAFNGMDRLRSKAYFLFDSTGLTIRNLQFDFPNQSADVELLFWVRLHSFAQLSKDCLDDQARFEFFADATTRQRL
jgi:hypothetical protein